MADDDPAILRLVTTILEKNYTVVSTRDGREAYKLLQRDPDFIAAILDVVMPHISGPELVRFMKTEKRLMRIPVMMMTAEQDPKLSSGQFCRRRRCLFPKPFTTAQLQIMLQMLIGKGGSKTNCDLLAEEVSKELSRIDIQSNVKPWREHAANQARPVGFCPVVFVFPWSCFRPRPRASLSAKEARKRNCRLGRI